MMTHTLKLDAKKFYLPQLDGLRFIAFFLVFIHHAALPPSIDFSHSAFFYSFFHLAHLFGWIGVDIFLCLSSFLLTTLLMLEHQKTGNVSIKQFIARRALRIWPLYYLIIFMAFVVFPHFSLMSPLLGSPAYEPFLQQHLFPFSIFLGNLSYAYFTSSLTVIIAPLWTISLEEQFYLFWPILLFILLPRDRKWFFVTLICMLIISFLMRFYIIKNNIPYPAIWVFTLGRLDPFALGALFAYFYLNPPVRPIPVIAGVLSFFLLKMVVTSTPIGLPNTIWQLLLVDLASCLLIYTALYSKKMKFLLSFKHLVWLGKISFGLYIFHDVILQMTSTMILPYLNNYLHLTNALLLWFLSVVIAFTLTVFCATISYYAFERHFLKLKSRFTVVASRPI